MTARDAEVLNVGWQAALRTVAHTPGLLKPALDKSWTAVARAISALAKRWDEPQAADNASELDDDAEDEPPAKKPRTSRRKVCLHEGRMAGSANDRCDRRLRKKRRRARLRRRQR